MRVGVVFMQLPSVARGGLQTEEPNSSRSLRLVGALSFWGLSESEGFKDSSVKTDLKKSKSPPPQLFSETHFLC
ncbi:hypothetical protein L484_020301 [Morus notabilis]|uniref:Uncharacterized protein n=1 Tax=Morus notabilis TaxID=981085 RepID=W9QGY1_9ROSA|nr:hypothetical protein L484_020301 [Morus notabilis]